MSKSKKKTMIRVNKRDKPYLMIDKTGINDVRLSWKAKGLLCYLLSLPDDWQVYVKELMNHASDGRDSTNTALSELMNYGYCIRTINRDESGHFKGYIYNIFEVPNSETIDSSDFQPKTDFPYSGNPKSDNPKTELPKTVNPKLLRNNLTNELNTLNNNYNNQSIYHSFSKDEIDKMDISKKRPSFQDENGTTAVTDNTNFYKEIISENIEYSYLKERYPYESIVDDILEIMVEVVTSNKDIIRVNGEDKPQEIVKSSFLKLDSSHIEYVLDCMSQNKSKANNIKAYMITTLYNAPMTINAYYTNLVKHDMANNF
jgi:hypothetical protein